MRLSLETEVKYVKGVGPRLAEVFAQRGIVTVEDLLYHLPFRYEDRSQLRPIRELKEGERATVVAQVQTVRQRRTQRGLSMLQVAVADGTGTLRCVWYNADYLTERFASGQTLALFGQVTYDTGRLTLRQPEFEVLEAPRPAAGIGGGTPAGVNEASGAPAKPPAGGGRASAKPTEEEALDSLKLGRIVPIYESIGSLTPGRLRLLVHRALADLPPRFSDALPLPLRERYHLPERRQALEQVHFPAPDTPLAQLEAARTPGHFRLIFEELFYMQAGLELKRRKVKREPAVAIHLGPEVREALKRLLPFHPTTDQKRALREIADDMCSGHPMRRLLQGDVGSGKTIVALEAAVIAMESGWQVAFMAPTQILAEQHYFNARERLPGYRVELVTAGTRKRRGVKAGTEPQLAIGTQALLQSRARLSRPGLVIVDEQHRFGVLQRFELMRPEGPRGPSAHLLVMTATPIPRTLALTFYGDLDASLIRQRPPGGMPVSTRVVSMSKSEQVYDFIERKLAGGRQAYFVYPIIEESETLDLRPALLMHAKLQQRLSAYKVGLLHGRLSAEEKNAVMQEFRAGRIQALVATSVIEVGLDVPNATLMVIEHAERFGVAQLHQLRGRIGRPQPGGFRKGERSYCVLMQDDTQSEMAVRRLQAVEKTDDGFELAELDLKLRGPGEFFGTRQSGAPAFDLAQPIRDRDLLELARSEAHAFLDKASLAEQRQLVQQIQERWQRRYGLIEAG